MPLLHNELHSFYLQFNMANQRDLIAETGLMNLFGCVMVKLDGWLWNIIVHLCYAFNTFEYYCIAICELKLELLSTSTQIWSKSSIFKLMWHWNLMDELKKTIRNLFHATRSYVCHLIALREFKFIIQKLSHRSHIIFWFMLPWNLIDDIKKKQEHIWDL